MFKGMGSAALAALAVAAVMAQDSKPSPDATADVTLGGKTITIAYNRPSMRGRKIMGGLVPYGQVWRTGANAATMLTTPVNLTIGGTAVPAGKYTLYTLPGENSWKLIINKQTGQWGTEYDEGQDLARVNMKVSQTSSPTEQFLISWNKQSQSEATLLMAWENTRASVPVVATGK
ncbi:MAG: DUF2911 domain-containing protein [Acidobacteriaceae bacterium]|nr:DUF2911 domain-containing protein [Acidobacteriaceae bacterium]